MPDEITLWVDLDGTTARFYDDPEWPTKMYKPGYFAQLQAYTEMVYALRQIIGQGKIIVFFLSSYYKENRAAKKEKTAWVAKMFPDGGYTLITITIPADKVTAAEAELGRKLTKKDYLLDDYTSNLVHWEHGGGSGIKCVNEIQNKPDFASYDGPRINPNQNAQFLFNTLMRLLTGKNNEPVVVITYGNDNNELTVIKTQSKLIFHQNYVEFQPIDADNTIQIDTKSLYSISIE